MQDQCFEYDHGVLTLLILSGNKKDASLINGKQQSDCGQMGDELRHCTLYWNMQLQSHVLLPV